MAARASERSVRREFPAGLVWEGGIMAEVGRRTFLLATGAFLCSLSRQCISRARATEQRLAGRRALAARA
jgi:hypothetical protein